MDIISGITLLLRWTAVSYCLFISLVSLFFWSIQIQMHKVVLLEFPHKLCPGVFMWDTLPTLKPRWKLKSAQNVRSRQLKRNVSGVRRRDDEESAQRVCDYVVMVVVVLGVMCCQNERRFLLKGFFLLSLSFHFSVVDRTRKGISKLFYNVHYDSLEEDLHDKKPLYRWLYIHSPHPSRSSSDFWIRSTGKPYWTSTLGEGL